MLVLSRKVGETIELPSLGVKIQIGSLKKSRVVIGIDAPGEVEILRGEKVGDSTFDRRLSLGERTLNEQLIALEAEIVALSEMASDEHDQTAKITARESIARLRKLRRQQQSEQSDSSQPLADFVAVRSEVLDHLMQNRKDALAENAKSVVRQASVGYSVNNPSEIETPAFQSTAWNECRYRTASKGRLMF